MCERCMDFVLEFSAPDRLTSRAISFWTACLNHEASDDSVEQLVVVVAIFGVGCEIFDSQGALLSVKLQVNFAHRCVNDALTWQHNFLGLLCLSLLVVESIADALVHQVSPNFVNFSLTWLSSGERVKSELLKGRADD